MKIEMDGRYQVVAVNVKKEGIMIAVAPDKDRTYTGDMVELGNGKTGIVVISDDYIKGTDLQEIEAASGECLLQVTGIFRKTECDWGEE